MRRIPDQRHVRRDIAFGNHHPQWITEASARQRNIAKKITESRSQNIKKSRVIKRFNHCSAIGFLAPDNCAAAR